MPKEKTRPWLFTSALGNETITVAGLSGWEGISKLYEFHLILDRFEEDPYGDSEIEEILDLPAVLFFDSHTDAYWHGIIRELELLEVVSGSGGGSRYRAVLVPSLWLLTQNLRSRCFLDLSVPEIVTQVLGEAGFDEVLEDRLTGTYPKREFTVQYQESDHAFISRLLEHEGIFYFFLQTADGEHLVLGDDNTAYAAPPDYDTVKYDPRPTNVTKTPGIHAITRCYRALPELVVLREYNWETPQLGLQAGEKVSDQGYGMQVLYGEHFKDDADGKRLAKLRAQERSQRNHAYRGRSSLRNLRAGHAFTLADHPDPDRFDITFVVTDLRHSAAFGGDGSDRPFSSELELLPQDVPYRPPLVTRLPRIHGLINAKIDGEAPGLPAPIDEQGRYRLLFPYDLYGVAGTPTSRWVRMAQSFSGPGYGSHLPLHIGAEVLVAHIDGDPDRPIIVGAIPNPATSSPVVQENATQSIVRTLGDIVVEFDDDAQVEASAQRSGE